MSGNDNALKPQMYLDPRKTYNAIRFINLLLF